MMQKPIPRSTTLPNSRSHADSRREPPTAMNPAPKPPTTKRQSSPPLVAKKPAVQSQPTSHRGHTPTGTTRASSLPARPPLPNRGAALANSVVASTVRRKTGATGPNVLPPSALRPIVKPAPETTPPITLDHESAGLEASTDGRRRRQRVRRETRSQMLERLTNPIISLHEASVILRVCPATVRRYTNSGLLTHVRTQGKQRRFYLRDVLSLMRQLESRRR